MIQFFPSHSHFSSTAWLYIYIYTPSLSPRIFTKTHWENTRLRGRSSERVTKNNVKKKKRKRRSRKIYREEKSTNLCSQWSKYSYVWHSLKSLSCSLILKNSGSSRWTILIKLINYVLGILALLIKILLYN